MAAEGEPKKQLTLEDYARGLSHRRWCFDCGNEFKMMPVGKEMVYGCKACWHKTMYKGKCPRNAAPYGAKAACSIIPPLPSVNRSARTSRRP